MSSGSVTIITTSPAVGDTLKAQFYWNCTKKNANLNQYAGMFWYKPNGNTASFYYATLETVIGYLLTTTATVTGTWKAHLVVWNGLIPVVYDKTVVVAAAPPPPPPPPPPTKYSLTITTIPGSCSVTISGVGTFTTPPTSATTIGEIPAGTHTITVSKENYTSFSQSYLFESNRTLNITLSPLAVICTPGALKCVGVDLYVCNTTGTAWTLKTANSPTCKGGGQIPDFWTDPVGWVIGTITAAWESMLGFVSGQFNLFLANIKSFQDGFVTQLVDFIQDPIVHVTKWVEGIIPALTDWWGDIIDGIGAWYDTNIGPTVDAIGAKIDGVKDWIGSGFDSIGDWWADASSGIWNALNGVWGDISGWIGDQWDNLGDWWDDQVEILQRGWDDTFGQIPDLIGGAVDGVKTWVEGFVSSFVEAITGSFFEGLTKGVEESGHSPLDVEKQTENDILKGLQGYMIKYRNERDKKRVK